MRWNDIEYHGAVISVAQVATLELAISNFSQPEFNLVIEGDILASELAAYRATPLKTTNLTEAKERAENALLNFIHEVVNGIGGSDG